MTASLSASFACASPATSSHFTFGFSVTIADESCPLSFAFSSSSFSSSLSRSFTPAPPDGFAGPAPDAFWSITFFRSSARFM